MKQAAFPIKSNKFASLGHFARLRNAVGLWSVLSLLFLPQTALAQPQTKVFLNGVPSPVYFNDGDSFTVLGGALVGSKARLAGFNTLESFGGAHRWGTWDPHELYVNAKMATLNGRRGVWHCTSDMKKDGYGRILWECPDLAVDNIRKGLAHAMSVTADPSPPSFVAAQKLAQEEKRGMWAKGIPPFVVTSTHSNDEGYEGTTYNRLISTVDGHTEKWLHKNNYKECEWVCHEGGSCMMYVGFLRRYGGTKASCLVH